MKVVVQVNCVVCGMPFERMVEPYKFKSYRYPTPKYCSRTCMHKRKTFHHKKVNLVTYVWPNDNESNISD